jgi:hypothetical protein
VSLRSPTSSAPRPTSRRRYDNSHACRTRRPRCAR